MNRRTLMGAVAASAALRFMAKRMGAKTIEIEASHLALISHPDAITNLILEALAV